MIAALIAQTRSFRWNVDENSVGMFVVAIAAITVIVLTSQAHRAKERRKRMEVLQEALRNPALPKEAQVELVRAVRPTPGRVPFVFGWFGLFGGVSWLCTEPRGDEWTVAVIFTVMSFALLTLPLAMRELEARRA